LCFNRFLSVAHITDDDEMSILEPTKITDTHVLVNVPHLSAFGLIWDTLLRFLHMKQPINCQVLLFLRPPGPGPSSRKTSAGGTLEKPKSLKRKLFNILKDLTDENFRDFKWCLEDESSDGSSTIQKAELENAERRDVVDLVVRRFGFEGALKVTEKVLKDIGMNNLVEELQNLRFH
ncbi:hypothetical protein GOODEAATRI_030378, partial [Goodea atripinnis]